MRGNGQEVDTRRPAQEEGESGQFHQHHGRMMVGEGTERQGTRRYSLTVVYLASPARKSRVIGPELRAWAEELLMLGVVLVVPLGKYSPCVQDETDHPWMDQRPCAEQAPVQSVSQIQLSS